VADDQQGVVVAVVDDQHADRHRAQPFNATRARGG
jgi:hypothetical protein